MKELKSIQGFLQQVTGAFAGVVDIEIGVISKRLEVIAGSGYFEKEVGVVYDEGCMTSKILSSPHNDSILVENTTHAVCCADCDYSARCDVLAFMMMPILFNEEKIGSISLLALTEQQRRKLLNQYEKMQNFLNKLCNMITISLNEKKMESRITSLMNQFRDVINSVYEGVIAFNSQGRITNINNAARQILSLKLDSHLGEHISVLFPDFNLNEVFNRQETEDDSQYYGKEIIYIDSDNEQLRLYYNITLMYEDDRISGAVISFRKKEEVEEMANRIIKENKKTTFSGIIGTSSELNEIKKKMKLIASTDSTVLIRGETGTGKSVFARAIHEESPRRGKPFISISCAAIPAPLLESELFGYEEGAFTGARKGGKPGKFEMAHEGTIFLDEIGDMPLDFQVKLLHVIENKNIARIGGVSFRDVDVRIIAATNRNLEELIGEGKFREDLFYRINVIPFTLPLLRDRKDDILLLMHHFLDYYSKRLNKNVIGFQDDAREAMLVYPWPGNVRELENAIEYAINIESDSKISRKSLPEKITRHYGVADPGGFEDLTILEKKAIKAALLKYGNTTFGKEKAASALGISRATLYRKLKSIQQDVS
ncbi:MAG: sigma 54-interacting transcriptional regulator [Bacillota bacterium]|nr:sigma 54-interacting transcriptional regulator [Bacillota bacterium]